MVCCMCHACVLLCWTLCNPWTTAHQVPLSTGFFSQEYWSRLPFPPPGDLIDLGIKPRSPALAGGFLSIEPPGKPFMLYILPPYIYIQRVFFIFFMVAIQECHKEHKLTSYAICFQTQFCHFIALQPVLFFSYLYRRITARMKSIHVKYLKQCMS